MGMNKTEQKLFNWLLSKGYSQEQIIFRRSETPDFITDDGKKWEAKRLYDTKILMYKTQVKNLFSDQNNTTVLVFKNGRDDPIQVIPLNEITPNTTLYKNIVIQEVEPKEYGKNVSIDENAHAVLQWAKTQCKKKDIEHPSFSDAIRWMRDILRKYSEMEK